MISKFLFNDFVMAYAYINGSDFHSFDIHLYHCDKSYVVKLITINLLQKE